MFKIGLTCKLPAPRHFGMKRAKIFATAVLLVAAPFFCKQASAQAIAGANASARIVVMDSVKREPTAEIDSARVVYKGECLKIRMIGMPGIRDRRLGRYFLGTTPVEIKGNVEWKDGKKTLRLELLTKAGQVVKVSYTYSDPAESRRKGYDLPNITMSDISVEPAK